MNLVKTYHSFSVRTQAIALIIQVKKNKPNAEHSSFPVIHKVGNVDIFCVCRNFKI